MLRRLLPASLLLLSGCGAVEQVVCEPCTQARLDGMSLQERTAAAVASGNEALIPKPPKRYEEIMQGEPFCETLPELSEQGVREHLIAMELPAVTEMGMLSLALCQLYYRDRDAASLTLHRFLVYLDFKEEKEGESEVTDYFKYTAGQLLSENGTSSIEFYTGSRGILQVKDEERWEKTDFFDRAVSTRVDDFWENGDLSYLRIFQ